MRYLAVVVLALVMGLGTGLLSFGLALPDDDEDKMRLLRLDHQEHNRLMFRATMIGVGSGFLTAGITGTTLGILAYVLGPRRLPVSPPPLVQERNP